jgi:hypothetical protein
MPRRRGRRTRYSKKLENMICQYLENTTTRARAYTLAGISKATFYRWLETREDFRLAVEQAEARAGFYHEQNVVVAGRTDWKASGWWLERRDPEHYALKPEFRHKHEVEGKIETSGTVKIEQVLKQGDRLARRFASLRQLLGEPALN